MKLGLLLFVSSVLSMPFVYFFGIGLFLVYSLVWADKIILGAFRMFRYIGIELTTLATVLASMLYGPFIAFIIILALFTFLQSLRYMIFPGPVPDYPLFVPNPDSIIYASGAFVATVFPSADFPIALIAVVVAKYIVYIAMDFFLRKPPHIPAFIGGMAFNWIVMVPLGIQLLSIVS